MAAVAGGGVVEPRGCFGPSGVVVEVSSPPPTRALSPGAAEAEADAMELPAVGVVRRRTSGTVGDDFSNRKTYNSR